MSYTFTQDWFAGAGYWESLKPLMKQRKAFLEIGSYEGRSTVWTVEHMMEDGGHIVAIDSWEGGEEHASVGEPMKAVEANFNANAAVASANFPERRIVKTKAYSHVGLGEELYKQRQYDFIYIDGSHKAMDVLSDACMSFHLLKPGGLMVFDDLYWGDVRDILHRPKLAIDAFCNIFAEKLMVVASNYQFVLMKE